MKPTLLLAIPLGKAFEQKFAERYTLTSDMNERKEAEALITIGALPADGDFMDSMPKLMLISCFGSGYESIDLEAAAKRGIKVTNTVGANSATVADHAVALLLASVRHVVSSDKLIRAGKWRGDDIGKVLFSPGMTGRRIGILGLGTIGWKIAERLAAFETEVAYFSRTKKPDAPWRYFDSLLALAEWADVLMIAHRADETNRHLINADVLKALGREGHIVNISRGSAVDEDALIAALKNGTIAGAGLDVFDDEPNVRPEFIELPNVVLTPHIGGGTREAFAAMSNAVLANVDAFFKGEPLPNPVV